MDNNPIRDDLLELYHRALNITNSYLEEVSDLALAEVKDKTDPSVDDMAADLMIFSHFLNELADFGSWDESRMSVNAAQAALAMRRLSVAVRNDDEVEYNKAKEELISFANGV